MLLVSLLPCPEVSSRTGERAEIAPGTLWACVLADVLEPFGTWGGALGGFPEFLSSDLLADQPEENLRTDLWRHA
jgi:hypothetical protein